MASERIKILGVCFDSLTEQELDEQICRLLSDDKGKYIVTPNPEIVEYAQKDDHYKRILNRADICLADGIGIVYASRILKTPIKKRMPGIEMGERLFSICQRRGERVFLLGGKPGVAALAGDMLKMRYPDLDIVGYRHGYFKKEEKYDIVNAINDSGATVLYVCLGFPYQEQWIDEFIDSLCNVKLAVALGGSLDVYSGEAKRAPRIFCVMGLEWLWRGICSPKRFLRMLKLPVFTLRVLAYRLKIVKKSS